MSDVGKKGKNRHNWKQDHHTQEKRPQATCTLVVGSFMSSLGQLATMQHKLRLDWYPLEEYKVVVVAGDYDQY
jgi:hypothetical protein